MPKEQIALEWNGIVMEFDKNWHSSSSREKAWRGEDTKRAVRAVAVLRRDKAWEASVYVRGVGMVGVGDSYQAALDDSLEKLRNSLIRQIKEIDDLRQGSTS